MKIESLELKINTPYIWSYFLIETTYDYKQIVNILSQINQFILGSSSSIVTPLNIKQKMIVFTNIQKIHNADNHWVIQSASAKSKTTKMLSQMLSLQNVDIKIKEIYLLHGALKKPIDTKPEPSTKVPQICQPQQNLSAFQEPQQFKASNQEELQAMAQFLQTKFKIQISGMTIFAYPETKQKIKQISQKMISRYSKRLIDVLKEDKKTLQRINQLCCGIM